MNWKHLDKESNFFSSHSSEAVGDHGDRTINSEGPSVSRGLHESFKKINNKKKKRRKKFGTTDAQSWLIYDNELTTENQCLDFFQILVTEKEHKSFYRESQVHGLLLEILFSDTI